MKGALGYTFFWSDRASEERHKAGSGVSVQSTLVDKLLGLSKGVSDRLMLLTLLLAYGKKHMTIISAYAPNFDESR